MSEELNRLRTRAYTIEKIELKKAREEIEARYEKVVELKKEIREIEGQIEEMENKEPI